MISKKALFLFLVQNCYSYYNTVVAKPEIAARFPMNPNANFSKEPDSSHRMLVETSYTQVGESINGDSSNHLIGYTGGVFISDDGLIIAFSSC